MNPQAIATSPLICICPSLINLEDEKWRAPKTVRFLPSLTDRLTALIGQEDTGGHQDRAADHEGLAQ